MKRKLLFVITQFYKGGAETSLLRLFELLDNEKYDVDFLILNQIEYQDATSLVGEVPEWIHIVDAVKLDSHYSAMEQVWGKIYRRLFHSETYRRTALDYVKNKEYDYAISFGEWLSPAFVTKKVKARKKYVWIHIDLDKADFVNTKELVKYQKDISAYIFASETSRINSIKKCPEMADKSVVVHNFLNREKVIEQSKEKICLQKLDIPYLLSVGNLRIEKNYPRQLEVMHLLKKKNISIKWFCVGSTIDRNVYGEVSRLLEKYDLKDDFIFCGADNNPYKYMRNAKAVMVLSDYESWSLVISEAKILGVPVIATDTSGAREQITDGYTGIITAFEPSEIADTVENYLKHPELQAYLHQNLMRENLLQDSLHEFESLLEK